MYCLAALRQDRIPRRLRGIPARRSARARAVPVLKQALTHTACTYTVKIWIFFGLAQVSRQKTFDFCTKTVPILVHPGCSCTRRFK